MIPIKQIIDFAKKSIGDEYRYGAEVDPADDDPGATDCSEHVETSCLHEGVYIPDGSWIQYRYCHGYKTAISVQEGIDTFGALLFRFSHNPLSGPRPTSSHVAFSLGNGKTLEARGRLYGVGSWTAHNRGWTHAALIPKVNYKEPAMAFDYTPPADLTDEEGEVFADAWLWADTAGIVNEHTNPVDIVEKQEMIVFLHRYHQKVARPALFTLASAVDDLQKQIDAMTNSGGGLDLPIDVRISRIP